MRFPRTMLCFMAVITSGFGLSAAWGDVLVDHPPPFPSPPTVSDFGIWQSSFSATDSDPINGRQGNRVYDVFQLSPATFPHGADIRKVNWEMAVYDFYNSANNPPGPLTATSYRVNFWANEKPVGQSDQPGAKLFSLELPAASVHTEFKGNATDLPVPDGSLGKNWAFYHVSVDLPDPFHAAPNTFYWVSWMAFTPTFQPNYGSYTNLSGAAGGHVWQDRLDRDGNLMVRVERPGNTMSYSLEGTATLDVDATFTRVNVTSVGLNELLRFGSWSDFDGDGWMDLFATGLTQNYLYRNNGNGTFTRITADNPIVTDTFGQYEPSVGMWADYNNDGHLDLVVAMGGHWEGGPYYQNVLYRGEGNGSFTRITDGAVVQDGSSSIQPAWGDYDNDGFLDVFFPSFRLSGTPLSAGGGADVLYHNDGTGGFVPVTDGPEFEDWRANFSGLWMDADGDGDLDLLNPGSTSFLYVNNAGDLSNRLELFPGNMLYGRGPAAADFDNDGDLDVILVADPDPDDPILRKQRSVFRNTGPLTFAEDIASGIEIDGGRSFDTSFADYDNDGWLDVVFARYTYFGSPHSCDLYHNNGDGTFTRVLRGTIPNATPGVSSAAWADLNNDGFQDLLLTTEPFGPSRPILFINGSNTNHWLNVRLVGTTSNRCAIGAKVRIKATINGKTFWQMRQIEAQGYHQNDPRASFGLGNATQVQELRIEWPSGQVTTAANIPSNQFLVITEGSFPKWIAGYGLTGANAAADADPDSDGLTNSVEYVLGGNPKVASTSGLPTGLAIGSNFVFTFNRADASETQDVALTVQAGPDLATWPTVFTIGPDTASSSPGVTVTENGAAPDTITVTIPQGTASIKFVRLTVTVSP